MANFKTPGLGIGLGFEHNDIYESNNFSEGSPDPKRDAQMIRVRFDILLSLSNKGKIILEIFILLWYCGNWARLFSFRLLVCNARPIYI